MLRSATLASVVFFCTSSFLFGFELDEAPAKPGEWGRRPADTQTVTMNPPGFTWRPTKNAARYELQVARDANFADIVYRAKKLRFSAHAPSKTLLKGTYYWRYRALSKDREESNWSQVRSFTIDQRSIPFPCPTSKELASRIPAGHPRLMFTENSLSNLRDLGQEKLADLLKQIEKQARETLKNPPDTTEPPLYPEGTVFKSQEWRTIWWGNRLRVINVADGAATLAFAYRLTGNEEYGRAARDLVIAMTEWNTDGSTSFRYNDEAAMPAMCMTSRAYTWAYPFFSEEDQQAVVKMMRARGQQCYDHLRKRQHLWRPYNSHSNRAWHFLGEIATAFHGDFPEAEKWLDYTTTILFTTYPVWGDDDGGWHEGTGYWTSYLRLFFQWTLTLDAVFDIDVFQNPFFHKTGDFALYTMPPGSNTGGFADMADHHSAEQVAPFVDLLGACAGNPAWLWYSLANGKEMSGGYLGYLYSAKAAAMKPSAPVDYPSSKVFRGVGVAVLNTNLLDGTDNIQVQFKSSPMGRQSHGYNANNAFLLNINGERALLRSGRRDIHGSPHHTEWMWESKSDNSILVNGRGQIKHSPEAAGKIVEFKTSNKMDVVVGEAADSYEELDRFTRRIIFLKPYAVVIHDILEARQPSTFQYTLHARGAFDIGENRVTWIGKPGRVEVEFLEPARLAIEQTDQFDTPPHKWANFDLGEWHLTADAREKVTRREFLSLIRINDAPVTVKHRSEEGGRTLRLLLPSGEFILELGDEEFSITGDGMDWSFPAAVSF